MTTFLMGTDGTDTFSEEENAVYLTELITVSGIIKRNCMLCWTGVNNDDFPSDGLFVYLPHILVPIAASALTICCNNNINDVFPLLTFDIQYGGGPALSHDDHCLDCLIHGAKTVVSADTYRDRRESMKSLARDILDGNCPDGKFYISRPWYDNNFLMSLRFMLGILGWGTVFYFLYLRNWKYMNLLNSIIIYRWLQFLLHCAIGNL